MAEVKQRTLEELFKKWDNGEHTFHVTEEALMKLEDGEKIGDLFSDWTICPIKNGTCSDFAIIKCYGINPNKPGIEKEIMVCTLGIEGDGEKCPLNK